MRIEKKQKVRKRTYKGKRICDFERADPRNLYPCRCHEAPRMVLLLKTVKTIILNFSLLKIKKQINIIIL